MDFDQTQAIAYDSGSETDNDVDSKALVAYLKVPLQKGFAEKYFPLYKGSNIVGRSADNTHVHIPIQSLSKKHCCIECGDETSLVYDMGSKNKTRIGKMVLTPDVRYQILENNELCLGDVTCLFVKSQIDAQNDDDGSDTGSESMFVSAASHQQPLERGEAGADIESMLAENNEGDPSSDILQPTQAYNPDGSGPLSRRTPLVEDSSDSEDVDSFNVKPSQLPDGAVAETPMSRQPDTNIVEASPTLDESVLYDKNPTVGETLLYEECSDSETEGQGEEPKVDFAEDSFTDDDVDRSHIFLAATQAYVPESDGECPMSDEEKDSTQLYEVIEDEKPVKDEDPTAEVKNNSVDDQVELDTTQEFEDIDGESTQVYDPVESTQFYEPVDVGGIHNEATQRYQPLSHSEKPIGERVSNTSLYDIATQLYDVTDNRPDSTSEEHLATTQEMNAPTLPLSPQITPDQPRIHPEGSLVRVGLRNQETLSTDASPFKRPQTPPNVATPDKGKLLMFTPEKDSESPKPYLKGALKQLNLLDESSSEEDALPTQTLIVTPEKTPEAPKPHPKGQLKRVQFSEVVSDQSTTQSDIQDSDDQTQAYDTLDGASADQDPAKTTSEFDAEVEPSFTQAYSLESDDQEATDSSAELTSTQAYDTNNEATQAYDDKTEATQSFGTTTEDPEASTEGRLTCSVGNEANDTTPSLSERSTQSITDSNIAPDIDISGRPLKDEERVENSHSSEDDTDPCANILHLPPKTDDAAKIDLVGETKGDTAGSHNMVVSVQGSGDSNASSQDVPMATVADGDKNGEKDSHFDNPVPSGRKGRKGRGKRESQIDVEKTGVIEKGSVNEPPSVGNLDTLTLNKAEEVDGGPQDPPLRGRRSKMPQPAIQNKCSEDEEVDGGPQDPPLKGRRSKMPQPAIHKKCSKDEEVDGGPQDPPLKGRRSKMPQPAIHNKCSKDEEVDGGPQDPPQRGRRSKMPQPAIQNKCSKDEEVDGGPQDPPQRGRRSKMPQPAIQNKCSEDEEVDGGPQDPPQRGRRSKMPQPAIQNKCSKDEVVDGGPPDPPLKGSRSKMPQPAIHNKCNKESLIDTIPREDEQHVQRHSTRNKRSSSMSVSPKEDSDVSCVKGRKRSRASTVTVMSTVNKDGEAAEVEDHSTGKRARSKRKTPMVVDKSLEKENCDDTEGFSKNNPEIGAAESMDVNKPTALVPTHSRSKRKRGAVVSSVSEEDHITPKRGRTRGKEADRVGVTAVTEEHVDNHGKGRRKITAVPAGEDLEAPEMAKASEQHAVAPTKGKFKGKEAVNTQDVKSTETTAESEEPVRTSRRGKAIVKKTVKVVEDSESAKSAKEIEQHVSTPRKGRAKAQKPVEVEGKLETAEVAMETENVGTRGGKAKNKKDDKGGDDKDTAGVVTESEPAGRASKRGRRKNDSSDKLETAGVSVENEEQVGHSRKGRTRGNQTSQEEVQTRTPKKDDCDKADSQASSQSSTRRSSKTPPSLNVSQSPSGTPTLRRNVKPKVLFTGVSEEHFKKIIDDLGGDVAKTPQEATHLITDEVRRTVKFMCCIAKGIPIVKPDWLKSCKDARTFIDATPFILQDGKYEKDFKTTLTKTLDQAAERRLFDGYKIHVTKSVKPPPKDMKDIIICGGGEYLTMIPKKYSENVIVVGSEEDIATCHSAVSLGIPCATKELILTGLLKHSLDIKVHSLKVEAVSKALKKRR